MTCNITLRAIGVLEQIQKDGNEVKIMLLRSGKFRIEINESAFSAEVSIEETTLNLAALKAVDVWAKKKGWK